MTSQPVLVQGAGSWGTALALVLARNPSLKVPDQGYGEELPGNKQNQVIHLL